MTYEYQNLIIDKLLNVLGLSIVNNYLYDDDNGNFLLYKDDGMLKYSNRGIFHKNDTVFDPLFSVDMANYMFIVYIKKESEDNGLYVQSTGCNNKIIQLTDEIKAIKTSVHIDSNEGSFDTSYYNNVSLCYIEAIFKLAGIFDWDDNLKMYLRRTDYTDEDIINRMTRG